MISSRVSIIRKNLLKINNVLENELGKLDKDNNLQDGIISGPLYEPYGKAEPVEVLESSPDEKKHSLPLVDNSPDLELKNMPAHLQYAYLEEVQNLPVVVATDLSDKQKGQLLTLLKKHKKAISLKISDIDGKKLKPSKRSHVPAISTQQQKTPVELKSLVKGIHAKQKEVTTFVRTGDVIKAPKPITKPIT
ncbi:hypothetical protein KIW84_061658 [Lathyrus oleraceus]|uniref:Uncharacterized protein n=1 Tax=Pisum sativum TaxID=3888 RepID=A0A9D4W4E3_PEA|nr:hypothetical protein KIW84_061658 [Pisum sativum]